MVLPCRHRVINKLHQAVTLLRLSGPLGAAGTSRSNQIRVTALLWRSTSLMERRSNALRWCRGRAVNWSRNIHGATAACGRTSEMMRSLTKSPALALHCTRWKHLRPVATGCVAHELVVAVEQLRELKFYVPNGSSHVGVVSSCD